jgi:hypothetical protein
MALSKEDVLEAIAEMSVMDVVQWKRSLAYLQLPL